MYGARLRLEERSPVADEELSVVRLDRHDVRIERQHEVSGRQRGRIEFDDLLALPGTHLPRAVEATEGGEVLVLDDRSERQLRPLGEVPTDQLGLIGPDDQYQLAEQARLGEVEQ